MVKDYWIVREETRCHRLAARVLLYASSHRQDNTYHGLCYTSSGPLDGTTNSSMKDRSDDHRATELHLAPILKEEGVVGLHLPTEPLKTRSGVEPVQICEHNTYQPIS